MDASTYLFYEYPSNFKFSLSFILASEWLELNDVIRLDVVLLKNSIFRDDVTRLLQRQLIKSQEKNNNYKLYLTWIARCRQYNEIIIRTPQYHFKKYEPCSIKNKSSFRTYLRVRNSVNNNSTTSHLQMYEDDENVNDDNDIEDIGDELSLSYRVAIPRQKSTRRSTIPANNSTKDVISTPPFLGPEGMFERCRNCQGCVNINSQTYNNLNNNNINNNSLKNTNNNNNETSNSGSSSFIYNQEVITTKWPLCSQVCNPLRRSSVGGKKWGKLLIHDDSYDHNTGVHLSLQLPLSKTTSTTTTTTTVPPLHLDLTSVNLASMANPNPTTANAITINFNNIINNNNNNNTSTNTGIRTSFTTIATIPSTPTTAPPLTLASPSSIIGPTAMMERCQNCQGCVSADGSKMLTWPECKTVCAPLKRSTKATKNLHKNYDFSTLM